jgi:hypothetical protein
VNNERARAAAFFLEVVLVIGIGAAAIEAFISWWKGKKP